MAHTAKTKTIETKQKQLKIENKNNEK